jgi:hypothetical protein
MRISHPRECSLDLLIVPTRHGRREGTRNFTLVWHLLCQNYASCCRDLDPFERDPKSGEVLGVLGWNPLIGFF